MMGLNHLQINDHRLLCRNEHITAATRQRMYVARLHDQRTWRDQHHLNLPDNFRHGQGTHMAAGSTSKFPGEVNAYIFV
jgi:hypothetical protein